MFGWWWWSISSDRPPRSLVDVVQRDFETVLRGDLQNGAGTRRCWRCVTLHPLVDSEGRTSKISANRSAPNSETKLPNFVSQRRSCARCDMVPPLRHVTVGDAVEIFSLGKMGFLIRSRPGRFREQLREIDVEAC
jgi:hypothetical protein